MKSVLPFHIGIHFPAFDSNFAKNFRISSASFIVGVSESPVIKAFLNASVLFSSSFSNFAKYRRISSASEIVTVPEPLMSPRRRLSSGAEVASAVTVTDGVAAVEIAGVCGSVVVVVVVVVEGVCGIEIVVVVATGFGRISIINIGYATPAALDASI